jgi:hypothetical protein
MELASMQARIDKGITVCHATLEDWREDAEHRYALPLDIRWPQHESLISGQVCASATWRSTPGQAVNR